MVTKQIINVGSITTNDKSLALKDTAWPLAIRKVMCCTPILKIPQNIGGGIIEIKSR
jgi:hypothetical protein